MLCGGVIPAGALSCQHLFVLPTEYGVVWQEKNLSISLSLCSVREASLLQVGMGEAEDNV